jgi:hypothetical protein
MLNLIGSFKCDQIYNSLFYQSGHTAHFIILTNINKLALEAGLLSTCPPSLAALSVTKFTIVYSISLAHIDHFI